MNMMPTDIISSSPLIRQPYMRCNPFHYIILLVSSYSPRVKYSIATLFVRMNDRRPSNLKLSSESVFLVGVAFHLSSSQLPLI